MAKTDLTTNSPAALSLEVFNTEHLYQIRHNWVPLCRVLNRSYIYTFEQVEELKRDLEADAEEFQTNTVRPAT